MRTQYAARARRNLEALSVDRVGSEYMAIYQRTLAERLSINRREAGHDARRARADGAL